MGLAPSGGLEIFVKHHMYNLSHNLSCSISLWAMTHVSQSFEEINLIPYGFGKASSEHFADADEIPPF